MNFKVLVSAPYLLPFIEDFRPYLESQGLSLLIPQVHERLEEEDLLPIIHDIDAVMCGDDRFTRKVFEAAKNLKVLSKWGTGIDSLNKEIAAEFGVEVVRTPNAFSEPVADTVLAYALNFSRNIGKMNSEMRAGRWEKINGRAMNESTFGVIGVGNCGKAVLRRAKAFGAKLIGYDIAAIDEEFINEVGLEMVDLKTLLSESDFVSLNPDLTESSYHLMNDERFDWMKPEAVLVNTSRGPIIDQAALVRTLEKGKLYGVGLDVFEDEPLPQTSELRKFERVMMAPHNSNSSPKAWARVHDSTIQNMLNVLNKYR
ncbi:MULTISPECIES: phosphoglycerate dehydrogenase [Thalassospira]|jgi:phosphoglycerate dehydrogenase-like enzyme|uniref:phosphoglycerate dehydrogenase n=1 Tax=Thalassospira TaxID=168934 RepID=UPI0007A5E8D5|nr:MULTISPECIES: phosphoglycerate dehydrogenase [unclassified Thalassospira]KZC99076.1 hypothetical protein AUQ41_11150 [Thalassospira sp. MCCC 1A02898]ONH88633.1 dihydrofolate reductase [Thalassospira sp. MCCC 1A02803]BDW90333.1 3-phosphoglycerate dehydrogenase [Thalassospira tepidiphila]